MFLAVCWGSGNLSETCYRLHTQFWVTAALLLSAVFLGRAVRWLVQMQIFLVTSSSIFIGLSHSKGSSEHLLVFLVREACTSQIMPNMCCCPCMFKAPLWLVTTIMIPVLQCTQPIGNSSSCPVFPLFQKCTTSWLIRYTPVNFVQPGAAF